MPENALPSIDDDYLAWKDRLTEVAELRGQQWAAWALYGEDSPPAITIGDRIDELSDQSAWPESWRRFGGQGADDVEAHQELLSRSYTAYRTTILDNEKRRAQRTRPTFTELQATRTGATVLLTPPTSRAISPAHHQPRAVGAIARTGRPPSAVEPIIQNRPRTR
ncbi:hypothetical protein [Nocardia camponoti]|uniref:Uncharacterized protein n=1 Tax=Nocardia camponoti TaxID=1616106 RepID=A0A917QUW9_9NOCA|nr:hypothetical protein [Nocardia camponoti]GGK68959.1 hypothetical protein GCM10011591_46350 [Nocardia camponoti]